MLLKSLDEIDENLLDSSSLLWTAEVSRPQARSTLTPLDRHRSFSCDVLMAWLVSFGFSLDLTIFNTSCICSSLGVFVCDCFSWVLPLSDVPKQSLLLKLLEE